jgi:hypothetical protein
MVVVVIIVVVAMDMDDVPRFELARDNMPDSKLAYACILSKEKLVQGCPPNTFRLEKLRPTAEFSLEI